MEELPTREVEGALRGLGAAVRPLALRDLGQRGYSVKVAALLLSSFREVRAGRRQSTAGEGGEDGSADWQVRTAEISPSGFGGGKRRRVEAGPSGDCPKGVQCGAPSVQCPGPGPLALGKPAGPTACCSLPLASQVLFLDSDNTPLRDPSFLLDHPAYTATGALLWPDYWDPSTAHEVGCRGTASL